MSRRPRPPDDVFFPVVPMIDVAFQLLAFFILTFQAPSNETRIDLDLPSAPAALPRGATGADSPTPPRAGLSPEEIGLETDLSVRAEADANGRLRSLRLGATALPGPEALADRLRRYGAILEGRPLTVSLAADDGLLYEEAARLLGACSTAGVAAVRLVPVAPDDDPPASMGVAP